MVIKNGLVFTEENTFLPLSVLTQGDNITSLVSDDTALPASENDELVIDAAGCYSGAYGRSFPRMRRI